MVRLTKKDVEEAVSALARELGEPLKLEAYSPGDRYGTRYRIYTHGDTPGSLGTRIFAVCGAALATEQLWTGIRMVQLYKRLTTVPTHAVDAIPDIEA